MKFRYKVLITNIILLSLSIGLVGYIMIYKNFHLALDTQVKSAVEENNVLQTTMELQLLDSVNRSSAEFMKALVNVGTDMSSNLAATNSEIYIIYGETLCYSSNSDIKEPLYPASLWQTLDIGQKNYVLTTEDAKHYIYVSSCNIVNGLHIYLINKREITAVYSMIRSQITFFQIMLLIVLTICSVCMYIISKFLTKPLEQLNNVSANFGKGDYSARTNIHTNDELETLSNTYNQMAEAVEEHVDKLNDMIKRQDQFVGDFTHEIKTPMTTIIGYADYIRSKEMSRENQIMAASYIFSEGKRLETMSKKLFDFIYLKQNDISLNKLSVLQLSDMISTSIKPALDKKNIVLKKDIQDCYIMGDADLLCSAFINIIDNARKASPENSEIIFTGIATDNEFTLSVQDFGCGISKEHIDKICREFYMVDKSRSRTEGGAGLGLSLAAIIFERHNAKFDINSTLGEGTTMSITFPLCEYAL